MLYRLEGIRKGESGTHERTRARGDDRVWVLEVARLVVEDLIEDVLLGDRRPPVMYTHRSAGRPVRPRVTRARVPVREAR